MGKGISGAQKDKRDTGSNAMSDIKKPCHDDPEYLCECYEDEITSTLLRIFSCDVLSHGGTWEDCRFGKDWKELEIKFEGD